MRKARVLLPMIFWAVLVHSASFGSQSDQGSGPASSQNQQTATAETAAKGNENGQVKAETEAGSNLDRNQTKPTTEARSLAKPHVAARRAKPVSRRQTRSATTAARGSLSEPSTPADNLALHQNGSSTSTGILHKTANPRSVPVPLTADSVNGQQFKNVREPGARMASSGGSASSSRGTAAINGSDMKRKP
jgi:hypothetical protein